MTSDKLAFRVVARQEPLTNLLRNGLAAAMELPDPANPSLDTIRVVTDTASHR